MLVALLKAVKSFPTQCFLQHEPDEKWWRIYGTIAVVYEELIDMADQLHWQIFE
jgi:hypothetical protein